MKYFSILPVFFLLSCATAKPYLSPIHEDMDKVCKFTTELNAIRDRPEQLGPMLRPEIKTVEVHRIMKSLDREGGDQLILLARSLGYERCDLIDALKEDNAHATASR